jgi:hypothetical protein
MLRSKLFGGSTDSRKSQVSKQNCSSISNSNSDITTTTEDRFPDSASNRSKETREAADTASDDVCVSSANPTKLFSFVKKRNWAGVVKRCKGGDRKEASTWVVEKHADGKTIWKVLAIHEVSILKIVGPYNAQITRYFMFTFLDSVYNRHAKIKLHLKLSKPYWRLIQNHY